MSTRRFSLRLLTLVALVIATPLEAASPRVFLSSLGRNNGNCGGLLNPCRDFETAVARVTTGGEIIILDSGPFPGGTINKAVTLSAATGVGTIVLGFPGLYVNAGPAEVVVIRGLVLKGETDTIIGVQIGAGRSLVVEGCVLSGMGLAVGATAGHTILRNTTIRDAGNAVDAIGGDGARVRLTVESCSFESNWDGINVRDNASASITHSTFSDNMGAVTTIPSSGTAATAHVDHCVISNNFTGVFANSSGGSSRTWLSNSTVTGNGNGVQVNEATLYSLGNNMIYGNDADGEEALTPVSAR